MSNINTLRETLFDTLAQLKAGSIDLSRANAINDVAQTIINTAKVEIEFMKVTDSDGTGFIPASLPSLPIQQKTGTDDALPAGVRVIQHRIK